MRRGLLSLLAVLCAVGMVGAADDPTGVIVDASHLELKRARFPRLFSEAGELIYPTPKLCENPDFQGFDGFEPSMPEAKNDKARVGAKPLVIKALRVKEKDPLQGSLVISDADAAQLKAANAKSGILDKDRVAIVIGQAVVSTKPDKDAKDVALDAAVEVTFSKPLSDDSAKSQRLVKVSAADGTDVSGSTRYDSRAKTVTFQPSSSWAKGTKYTVVVAKEAEAEGLGRLESDYTFTFTTQGDAGADGGKQGNQDPKT